MAPNNFTYTDPLPIGSNSPSTDRPNMTVNNSSVNSLINVDHISFNENKGGIHRQVRLINQAPPGLGDGAGDIFANLVSGQSQPFWQNALATYQLFGGNSSVAGNGYLTLGNIALTIQWGNYVPAGGFFVDETEYAVTFPISYVTTAFGVLITGQYTNTGSKPTREAVFVVRTDTLSSKTGFTFEFVNETSSNKYTSMFWVAIGS